MRRTIAEGRTAPSRFIIPHRRPVGVSCFEEGGGQHNKVVSIPSHNQLISPGQAQIILLGTGTRFPGMDADSIDQNVISTLHSVTDVSLDIICSLLNSVFLIRVKRPIFVVQWGHV